MKNKLSLLLLVPTLIFSSCSNQAPQEGTKATIDLPANLRISTSTTTTPYKLTFNYKDSYFKQSSKTFNKDLALISLASCYASVNENQYQGFLSTLKFDNIETHFEKQKTKDTISYTLAHKKIDDFDLVTAVVDGFAYKAEWAGNFEVGEEGDHLGFSIAANTVYQSLKTYIAQYENAKLWLTGYSRGAAVANYLSYLVMSKDELGVSQDNFYVYTVESPKSLIKEHAFKYENVFNIMNSRDIVTEVPPSKFELYRCGIDIDVYQANIKSLLRDFDPEIYIPSFKSKSGTYSTEIEFKNWLIDIITEEDPGTDPDANYVSNRKEYVQYLEHPLITAFEIAYGLSDEGRSELLTTLMSQALTGFEILFEEGKLFEVISPVLDKYQYPYDSDSLRSDCELLRKFAKGKLSLISSAVSDSDLRNNVLRLVDNHYIDLNYVLLKNYTVTR